MIRLSYCIILACLLGLSSVVSAQFCPSVSPEQTYPMGANVTNPATISNYAVGNAFTGFGTTGLYVTGWSGRPLSGFSWQLTDPSNPTTIYAQGSFPYANVQDMEVGITTVNGGHMVFVAYYQNGVGHFVDMYQVTFSPVSPVVYVSSKQLSNATTYGRIRMDCHSQYAIAIVWHYPGLGIQAIGADNGAFGNITSLLGTFNESGPDLAFSHSSDLNVHFIYHNKLMGAITTSVLPWDSLLLSPFPQTPVIEDVNYIGSSADLRAVLDCPDHFPVENWAYTYTTNNSDIMVRFMDYFSTAIPTTMSITDGTTGLPPINLTYKSYAPCLSYSDGYMNEYIRVGWYATNGGFNNMYADMSLSPDGLALIPCYTEMPNSLTPAAYPFPLRPGIAYSKAGDIGTIAPQHLYASYYDYDAPAGNFQVHNAYHTWNGTAPFKGGYQRHLPECGTNRKSMNLPGLPATSISIYPNPVTDAVTATFNAHMAGSISLRLTDITGRIVGRHQKEVTTGINTITISNLKQLPAGIYHLSVSFNGQIIGTQRVSKE